MKDYMFSLIIPVYNEDEIIKFTYKRIKNVLMKMNCKYEILFIDDGSTDKSLSILKEISIHDSNVKIVSLSRNFGQQIANSAGVDYANGDFIGFIDADMQDPPEILESMLNILINNNADVIYGVRKSRKGESFLKKETSHCFYRFYNKISDCTIPVDTGDFKIINKKVANAFKQCHEKKRFLRNSISWLGFKQIPYYFNRDKRLGGKTKYSFKNLLKLSIDGIFINASKLTLFPILSSLIIFFLLILRCIDIIIPIDILLELIFILLFFNIFIILKYLINIYDESKDKPLYIVKYVHNIKQ